MKHPFPTYEDIYALVVKQLPFLDPANERYLTQDFILFNIEKAEQYIQNYTARHRVPYRLRFVWADLTVEILMYMKQFYADQVSPDDDDDDGSGGIDISAIGRIKMGDTELSLGAGSVNSSEVLWRKAHTPDLDSTIYNLLAQLNHVRITEWADT